MTKAAFHLPPPTEEEADSARVSAESLHRHADRETPMVLVDSGTFKIPAGEVAEGKPPSKQAEPVEIPAAAVRILADILHLLADGRGVAVIPEDTELTTVQAADVLNVSRPYLIKCLEDGKIPHRMVGKHRRIRLDDVLAYKEAVSMQREAVLDALVADAQEQGMGYDS